MGEKCERDRDESPFPSPLSPLTLLGRTLSLTRKITLPLTLSLTLPLRLFAVFYSRRV